MTLNIPSFVTTLGALVIYLNLIILALRLLRSIHVEILMPMGRTCLTSSGDETVEALFYLGIVVVTSLTAAANNCCNNSLGL